jgi:hypothetical protein
MTPKNTFNEAHSDSKVNVAKIATSGIAGLAGGAALGSLIIPASGALIVGSLLGAGITALAEYKREKKTASF